MKQSSQISIVALFAAVSTVAFVPYWRLGETLPIRVMIGAMELTFIFTGVAALLVQDMIVRFVHDEHPEVWEKLGRPSPIIRIRFKARAKASFPSWDIFYQILRSKLNSPVHDQQLTSKKSAFLILIIGNIISGATLACFVYLMANR